MIQEPLSPSKAVSKSASQKCTSGGCDSTFTDCAFANAGLAASACLVTSDTCSASFVPPVSAFVNFVSAGAGFNIGYGSVADTGPARVSSAFFIINEAATSAVPEPNSVLLGITVIGVLAGRKRLIKDGVPPIVRS